MATAPVRACKVENGRRWPSLQRKGLDRGRGKEKLNGNAERDIVKGKQGKGRKSYKRFG